MPLDPRKSKVAAADMAKKAAEASGKLSDTRKSLDFMKGKMEFFSGVKDQLKELASEFKDLEASERLKRIGGLAILVGIGLFMNKEDAKHFEKGHDEIDENETLEATEGEKEMAEAKKEAEEKVAAGEMARDELDGMYDPLADKKISAMQSATNMYAIRYYDKNGKPHPKPNGIAKRLMKHGAIPSTFILQRSRALFKEGVGTYSYFLKNVTDKLVHESVKDPKERIRQAALILSYCAVGRFQILPAYHFTRLGWTAKGEEGLWNMYNYIRSTDRQIALFQKCIFSKWKKYGDVGLVAIAYYAGHGSANAFQKDPDNEKWKRKNWGGHGSIYGYAQKARNNFNKYKQRFPGLKDIDYAAMTIETNETGRGVIYARAKRGKGLSDMRVASRMPEFKKGASDSPAMLASLGPIPAEAMAQSPEVLRGQIVERALSYSDSNRFDEDFEVNKNLLKGGRLGCAWVISSILKEVGVMDGIEATVRETTRKLKRRGWREAPYSKAEPGDIVVWAKIGQKVKETPDGPQYEGGHSHIGIVVGENLAVSNSSSKRRPRTHKIKTGRPVEMILKPPKARGVAPGIDETMVAKRKGENPAAPKGAKTTNYANLSPEVRQAAIDAQRDMRGQPVGSETTKVIDGKTYVFQRQWHFNRDPNGAHGTGVFEMAA